MPQSDFAAQLELLAETHEVIPLSRVLEPTAASAHRPRAAITFDDAYRGAVTVGIEELAKRGLPATVFVAPGFVGGKTFWWDAIAGAPREWAVERLRGEDLEIRRQARPRGYPSTDLPDTFVAATEDELRRALEYDAVTLGSHSWSHPNLARLTAAELDGELVRPLDWLRERFDRVIPWLAYPYGRYSTRVAQAAAEAGYDAALRIDGGWLPRKVDEPYALPRLNVPAGMTVDGFALRLAGLLCG